MTAPEQHSENSNSSRPVKGWIGQPFDFVFVGSCYIGLAVLGTLFSIPDLYAHLAFAALSALLLLRKRRATRMICSLVIALNVFGILHTIFVPRW